MANPKLKPTTHHCWRQIVKALLKNFPEESATFALLFDDRDLGRTLEADVDAAKTIFR
jgi:hypothetical protein